MGRRKMKGGGDAELADPNFKNSAYKHMGNKLFLNFIFCISLMGFIWFFISTFLVKHMYSEVLCYTLMLTSIIFSLFLMISIGVLRMQGSSFMKKFFSIVMFVITKCLPGLLIGVQLAIMISLMSENALYMYSTPTEDRPKKLDIFNGATALGITIQMFMYRNHLYRIIFPDGSPISPAVLPGFILVGILTSWCIGQLFVILKFLKVDG
tara:strand:+ start:1587 stop:2213 length:627 start_codon:yes stop_codon:yes gene_type:complete